MKDYSVLNGMIENQKSELRTAYDKGYNQGVKDFDLILATSKKEEEGYNRGLEDAWACAKRIIKLSPDMQEDIFNMRGDHFILDAHSAEEAIDILKRYDEKNDDIKVGDKVRTLKDSDGVHDLFPIGTVGIVEIVDKENELNYKVAADGDYWWYRRNMIELVKDDEIKVGDEVVDPLGIRCVVVTDKPTERGDISLLSNSFQTTQLLPVKELKKTGRHFPQIAEVLEKMRGRSDA